MWSNSFRVSSLIFKFRIRSKNPPLPPTTCKLKLSSDDLTIANPFVIVSYPSWIIVASVLRYGIGLSVAMMWALSSVNRLCAVKGIVTSLVPSAITATKSPTFAACRVNAIVSPLLRSSGSSPIFMIRSLIILG